MALLAPMRTASAGTYNSYNSYNTTVVLPSSMVVGDQYYDFSVSGIENMCSAQPALCDRPDQQEALEGLVTHRKAGLGLLIGGGALALASTLLLVPAFSCGYADSACSSNTGKWMVGFGVAEGLGMAAILTSLFVFPNRNDLQSFVNRTNVAHPDAIKLQLGWLSLNVPGLKLAGTF